jgi:sugar (pentulose or hexulose) kinase
VHAPGSIQMLADILQRAVGAVPDKSPAAVGAALLSRRIAGVKPQLDRHTRSRPLIKPYGPTARDYTGVYQQYLMRSALCGT